MLFFLKKAIKAGCVSVGAVVCGSVGYNGSNYSA